jgi:alkanesulfonate monooxygenase SsuD/methylene tetrahydromethanopterin reductase-like flavin-dependent oxidoreductase (luciferase family)
MRRLATIAATAALLTGCAAAGSDVRPAACGWLVEYPPAVQARAAAELEALAPGAALRALVEDYGELRARLRAACAR